jgi:23S rRNA pseudouridine2604 synthase
MTEPIRISKILAERGVASRTEADRMIERGWVRVNGRVAQSGDRALPTDEITLTAEAQARVADSITVILNKPRGFVSSPDESGGARAVSLLVSENFCGLGQPSSIAGRGLRVAGRLAVAECGLVVYTTDTALARRLAAPYVEEIWRVSSFDALNVDVAAQIANALNTSELAPTRATLVDADARDVTIRCTSLVKAQLSAVCAELGVRAQITRLQRGEIALGAVAEGQWLTSDSRE